MYSFGLVVFELAILFILTRTLTQSMYASLFILTNSRSFSISMLSILFFPGTVMHELAHLFAAEILDVHTGGLTLVPEGIEKNTVRTGSVSIAKTDPFRRAIIGIAPLFVGIATLSVIAYFLPTLVDQAKIDNQNGMLFASSTFYYLLITVYALFAVSNSMFSSREDMEGFWPVAITIVVLIAGIYFTGIRINLPPAWQLAILQMGTSLSKYLGYVVGLNVLLYALSALTNATLEKITGKRLVRKN